MTSINSRNSILFRKNKKGIVSIELAFIIPILVFIFLFSWQTGRHFYWQQQFDFTTSRFSKILVLEILDSGSINQQSFADALAVIQQQPGNNAFDIGLKITILSDDDSAENSFQVGNNCSDSDVYPDSIKNLPSVDAVKNKRMPTRYILGLNLCAQAKNWNNVISMQGLSDNLINSHSYYPINHIIFN